MNKTLYLIKSTSIVKFFEILLTIFWLTTLQNSDSLFIPYLIIGVCSILCCFSHNTKYQKNRILSIVFSLFFSFFICAANYTLFPNLTELKSLLLNVITIITLTFGSFIVFYNIFSYLPFLVNKIHPQSKNHTKNAYSLKPSTIFFISLFSIAIIYLLVLFLCKYPGNLTIDSTRQIEQTIINEYNNHHPFAHTIIIKCILSVGKALFGNLNASVALYSTMQILFLAGIFAYSIVTLYQIRCSKVILTAITLFYMLCPYHIMYSMTMWKDVVFGGAVLLLIISQYRIFRCLGKKWLNYLFLTIGILGTCLFRNNGFYAIIMLLIIFLIFFWREVFSTKKLLPSFIIITSTIMLTFLYNMLLLPTLNVKPTEPTESLSVPLQQIAKTIRDNNLSPEELQLLNDFIDTEHIEEIYKPYISDPVKKQVLEKSNYGVAFIEQKNKLVSLYLKLGLTYPISYLTAWIDLTRGYYNGGYDYWVLSDYLHPNDFGIEKTHQNNIFNKLFNSYLLIFEKNQTLRIFYCIGFAVWLTIMLLFIAIINKSKEIVFLISLPLLIIVTLLIATPVFSEFRYAYSIFCCLPFLTIINLVKTNRLV